MSGTMIAAHKAGIPIFATGGIGGVHRGVEESECLWGRQGGEGMCVCMCVFVGWWVGGRRM